MATILSTGEILDRVIKDAVKSGSDQQIRQAAGEVRRALDRRDIDPWTACRLFEDIIANR